MHPKTNKPKENESRAVANSVGCEENDVKQSFRLIDNRQGIVTQKKLQSMVMNNLGKPAQLQEKIDIKDNAKSLNKANKIGHGMGCCCGNCSGLSPLQLKSGLIIQRVRYLSDSQASSLETHIQNTLSDLEEDGDSNLPIYGQLNRIFNSFGSGSNAHSALSDIINATRGSTNARVANLNATVNGMLQQNSQNIRTTNYPSSYNTTANNARDTYRDNHLVGTTQWRCPGNGSISAHDTNKSDITIDHITPCATHWNNTGYNTNRSTRDNWYSDTSNHRYMCRSCNSSLGSGGIVYRLDTGTNYSN